MAALDFSAINHALVERLMDMTPPLDEEERLDDLVSAEANARAALEADGCPPCYPPEVDIRIEPPPEYRPIMDYWNSFSGTCGAVLGTQLARWEIFRSRQARCRLVFKNHFRQYKARIHARLSSHGIDEQFNFQLDIKDQSKRDTWAEFHELQLQELERMLEKRDTLREQIADAPAIKPPTFTDGGPSEEEWPAYQLGIAERDVDRHRVFLQWIAAASDTMRQDSHAADHQPDAPPAQPSDRAQRARRHQAGGESSKPPGSPKQKTAGVTKRRTSGRTAKAAAAAKDLTTKIAAAAAAAEPPSSSVARGRGPSAKRRRSERGAKRQSAEPSAKRDSAEPSAKRKRVEPSARRATSQPKGRKAKRGAPQGEATPPILRTRSGRSSRAPVRYAP